MGSDMNPLHGWSWGGGGLFSECRRSSCSSFQQNKLPQFSSDLSDTVYGLNVHNNIAPKLMKLDFLFQYFEIFKWIFNYKK